MDALKRTQWLASTVLIGTALVLAVLLGRVVWLQRHITADERERLVRENTAVAPIMPATGNIYLGDGNLAAGSVRMYNLFADPAFIMNTDNKLNPLSGEKLEAAKKELGKALAPLLKMDPDQVLQQISDNQWYKDRDPQTGNLVDSDKLRRFLWLAREVDEGFYDRFNAARKQLHEESREAAGKAAKTRDRTAREELAAQAAIDAHTLDGVGFVKSVKRIYPLGQLGGAIIGFRNNYEGVDGMERQLDFMLRGRPGQMLETKDAGRHTILIQDQHYTPPDDGRNVWLTVDTVIQGVVEEELAKAIKGNNAEGGTAIVMDPFTGRILAIANCPFLDPNQFGAADPKSRRDKAVTDPYEPGSIFKPFVMAGAIENHVVRPTDPFDCHGGRWHDPTGREVRDTHGYAVLTAQDVLVKSSNIGMTQVGWRMGIPLLYETVTKFGFGQRTGVELPGDQKGLVRPLSVWNKGTLTSVSFGYEVAATPLQLLRAYATFANGGYLVTPRIIHAVENQPGKTVPLEDVAGAPIQKQIISKQTAQTMRDMMENVYIYGTAKSARSQLYRLFGKTGTAHIAGKAGNAGTGYAANDYNSSFLCGGPMADPRLVVIVTVNKPHGGKYFGGTVAAPAATSIIERSLMHLQIPADQMADAGGARRMGGH